jgi:antagonist of KipI
MRVISPGMFTTVQDLGRPGYAHLGISASGVADALSLRAGNRLVGNSDSAAALEMTLVGGTFEFESAAVVALTGGDFDASLPMWRAIQVTPGESVRIGPAKSGARAYLCVAGGIDTPRVMGSRSSETPLRKAEVLPVAQALVPAAPRLLSAQPTPPRPSSWLRVTHAPQSHRFHLESFTRAAWQVKEDSNRLGLRLRGPTLECHAGHMLTEGVPLGAVQVPPDGQPIILFVDQQTTGGYPKIANVISADFHAVGQLRPRDEVRFEFVTLDAALALLREQEAWLDALV